MQQIKIFTTDSGFRENWVSADEKANKWLSENPNVRVLDIRYQANISGFADSGVSVYNRKIDFSDTFSLTWVTKSQNRVTLTPSTMLTKALFEELKRYSSGDLVCKVTHKQSAKQSSAYVIVSEVVDLKNLDSYLTRLNIKNSKGIEIV